MRFLTFILAFVFVFFTCCNCDDLNSGSDATLDQPTSDEIINSSSNESSEDVSLDDNQTSTVIPEISDENTDISIPELSLPNEIEPEMEVSVSDIGISGKELSLYGEFSGQENSELFDLLYKKLRYCNNRISLIIWNTDGSKALAYNTQQDYYSASTIKIAYTLSCCLLIDEGLADKNEKIKYEEKYYHEGDGELKFEPFGTYFTIEELIGKCISVSDNIAYEMLIERFGRDTYNALMVEYGCDSLIIPEEKLWAKHVLTTDFLIIWEKLYKCFNEDTIMSKILKDSCTNTVSNYATKTLADGIDYSHKQGDYYGSLPSFCDAGIIWDDNPYIFVIFTNIDVYEGDKSIMRSVMNTVFDIMGTERIIEE